MTLATGPAWRSGSEPETSPLDGQAPRLEQGLSDDASPLFQKTTHGLTGNPQVLSRFFVTEAFQVDQAHGFELVDLQDQILQIPGRDSDRLEEVGTGKAGDLTGTVGTSQDGDLLPHEGIELSGRLAERPRPDPTGRALARAGWPGLHDGGRESSAGLSVFISSRVWRISCRQPSKSSIRACRASTSASGTGPLPRASPPPGAGGGGGSPGFQFP